MKLVLKKEIRGYTLYAMGEGKSSGIALFAFTFESWLDAHLAMDYVTRSQDVTSAENQTGETLEDYDHED